MAPTPSPVFWRDSRMPHVELRQVHDGRDVCYAPHSHTQWSIGAITGGRSTFCYRSDHYLVGEGDLVLMNPEWVHNCNPVADQPWAYFMMYVDSDWLTDLRYRDGLLPSPQWRDLDTAVISDPEWYRRYCELALCLLDPQRTLLEKQTAVVEFVGDLMLSLARHPDAPQQSAPATLQALARYLDDHAADDLSLETLCARSGYSAGHLIRAFRQYFGLTPHAYQINRRVQLGRQALRNGVPIADAALDAGFADQAHFQRTFKKLMAATPKQYRVVSANHQIETAGGK